MSNATYNPDITDNSCTHSRETSNDEHAYRTKDEPCNIQPVVVIVMALTIMMITVIMIMIVILIFKLW